MNAYLPLSAMFPSFLVLEKKILFSIFLWSFLFGLIVMNMQVHG